MVTQEKMGIDPLSARSLYLKLMFQGQALGPATGFIVEWNDQWHLITNWHVVSGRHPETSKLLSPTAAIPDEIEIRHHSKKFGTWVTCVERLMDYQGNPRWFEHPSGCQVDVVALPLQAIDAQVKIYSFPLSLADTDMIPTVAMPVSIIGFPLGLATAGSFPIWKTGHIASDPGLNYDDKPAFLIDATTRGGMSGSPVVLRLLGGFETRSGRKIIGQTGPSTRFLGVYSGRTHGDSEIGIVWRPHVITDIFNQITKDDLLPSD